jgi:hypothetical protein
MIRTTQFRPFLGALALLVAAACSDSTGPDLNETFTEEDAEWVASDASGDVHYMADQMDFGLPYSSVTAIEAAVARAAGRRQSPRFAIGDRTLLRTQLLAAREGCTITASGTEGDPEDPYDGNDNGIPDDYRLSIDCVETEMIGDSVTEIERYRQVVHIKERAGDLHGYELSFRWEVSEEVPGGDRWREWDEWSEVLSIRGDRATMHWTDRGVEEGSWGGEPYRDEWSEQNSGSFTPDDLIVLGEALPDGELELEGVIRYVESEWGAIEFRIDTHEPLTYSTGCEYGEGQPFVDGALRGSYRGDVDRGFRISYLSCGDGQFLEVYGDTPGEGAGVK